jgi:quinol monooxygenase YgiN
MMHLKFALMLAVVVPLAAAPAARAQDAATNPTSANPTIYVVSYIDVAPTAKGQVATLLKQLADASRKEPGVMRFEVLQRTAPANQFAILEVWKDQPALDAHTAAAPAKQFNDKLSPLLVAPRDDRINLPFAVGPVPATPASGAIYVVTHVDVNPPGIDEENAALKTLAAASRKDAGNLRFDVTVQQKGRGNHYAVFEVWKDQKSLDAHEVAPSTKAFRTSHGPLSGALYDQRWYKAL